MKDYSFRIGEENINNYCNKMKVIDIVDSKNVIVEFVDFNYTKKVTYYNFKKGLVGSPFDRTICGIGYIGVGKYKPYENGKQPLAYRRWVSMLRRCYDPKTQKKRPRYEGCKVCEKWHYYQNFAEWFYNNYYEVEGEKMCLDKDILFPGNKIYAPDKCILIPQRINMLFMNKTNKRKLPNGIVECASGYLAQYNHERIGIYKTLEEAYKVYSNKKKEEIIKVANEYKGVIPEKAYNALLAYEFDMSNDRNYMIAA